MDIEILPLVPNAVLPAPASASTRDTVPPGYGVQEQCLPFTAAASLGLLVRSPIDFGLEVPDLIAPPARVFRCPYDPIDENDSRMFYVRDNSACRFVGNAFTLDPLTILDAAGQKTAWNAVQPGISFFDRADQRMLFKLHLPFILRTPAAVDSLFTAAINRDAPLDVLTGLVETDWYAHPVNLVARKPKTGSVHVRAGDVIAQIIFIPRKARRANVDVILNMSVKALPLRDDLLQWYLRRAQDRAAYKRLARSRHGRVDEKSEP